MKATIQSIASLGPNAEETIITFLYDVGSRVRNIIVSGVPTQDEILSLIDAAKTAQEALDAQKAAREAATSALSVGMVGVEIGGGGDGEGN